jgi:Domain of unknown function (DUF4185)
MPRPNGPLVESVRDLGVQFLDNDVNATGFDCASSIPMPGDRSLWIFGDTVEGPFETIRHYPLADVLSGTGGIVPLQDISGGVHGLEFLTSPDGRPRQLLPFITPEDKAKQRLWAIHGSHVGGRLWLYYHKITMDPELDVFEAFTLDGMGLARGGSDFRFERLMAPDGTREFWKGDQPGFGVFVQEFDGYLYLWGCIQPGAESAGDMHLARVRPNDIEDLAAYEYLVEAPTIDRPEVRPRWSDTFARAAPLFDHVPNEMSSSYNTYLGRFISFTTFEREDRLVIRSAPEITGPWSEPETFLRPRRATRDSLFNAGKEHPEFARLGGKVLYMTYIDSSVYAPHLVEITLA